MKRLLDATIVVCLAAAISPSCAFAQDKVRNTAPELGRLFFTAAERERLEQDRGRVPDKPNPDTPQSVSVSGLIARSGQPSLPVINGKVVFPGDNPSGLRIRGSADGRVTITPPDGPGRVAKPGQSVDLVTGEIREMFELPGQREARKAEIPLHTPYITGTLPKAGAAPVPHLKKAKRPKRGKAKRGAGPPPKPKPDSTPPPAPKVAPPSAAAPAIPAPLPRQP